MLHHFIVFILNKTARTSYAFLFIKQMWKVINKALQNLVKLHILGIFGSILVTKRGFCIHVSLQYRLKFT